MTDEILAASPAADGALALSAAGPATDLKPQARPALKSKWTVATYARLCGMARLQAFRLNQQRKKRLARAASKTGGTDLKHDRGEAEPEDGPGVEGVEWTVVDVCAAVLSDVARQVKCMPDRRAP